MMQLLAVRMNKIVAPALRRNNRWTSFFLQSAGPTKDEKEKGKKGKKGKGKEEPTRKPSLPLKPAPKPRQAEAATKNPEEMGGKEETEQKGEEGGTAEQEEKVKQAGRSRILSPSPTLTFTFLSQEDEADQDNPGAEVGALP